MSLTNANTLVCPICCLASCLTCRSGQKIDDDADRYGIQFVSNNERAAAKKFGITAFPKLLFFKHKEPTVYQGDLMNEEQVLEWLTSESIDMHDKIELATAKSLPGIIDSQDYVAVLFCEHSPIASLFAFLSAHQFEFLTKCLLCLFPHQQHDQQSLTTNKTKNDDLNQIHSQVTDKCKKCDRVLQRLEEIDDDADQHKIGFVKINDKTLAFEYGLEVMPSLVYYRKKVPIVYDGMYFFFFFFWLLVCSISAFSSPYVLISSFSSPVQLIILLHEAWKGATTANEINVFWKDLR